MGPYKLRLTPEQQARYDEISSKAVRDRFNPQKRRFAGEADIDKTVLASVMFHGVMPRYKNDKETALAINRLRRNGYIKCPEGRLSKKPHKWILTDAGKELVRTIGPHLIADYK